MLGSAVDTCTFDALAFFYDDDGEMQCVAPDDLDDEDEDDCLDDLSYLDD